MTSIYHQHNCVAVLLPYLTKWRIETSFPLVGTPVQSYCMETWETPGFSVEKHEGCEKWGISVETTWFLCFYVGKLVLCKIILKDSWNQQFNRCHLNIQCLRKKNITWTKRRIITKIFCIQTNIGLTRKSWNISSLLDLMWYVVNIELMRGVGMFVIWEKMSYLLNVFV